MNIRKALIPMLAALWLVPPAAHAEVTEINVVSTIGLAQFPARVAVEQNFIAQRAAKAGLGDVKVNYLAVTSGVVVSQSLLAGRADVGVGGVIPLFQVWDKSHGQIKGMLALSQGNNFLISCDPRIKTLDDYASNDRIAMTGVKNSTYAIQLQMQAAKLYGWEQRGKFDAISVPMSDPEGVGAIQSCRSTVKSQMTIMPQSTVELSSGKGHVVLSSKDILGTPYTFDVAFTTEAFRQNNPKTYQAILDGFADTIAYLQANPERTAELYMKAERFSGTKEVLVEILNGKTEDDFSYTTEPHGTDAMFEFMQKSGAVGDPAKSAKDVWFAKSPN